MSENQVHIALPLKYRPKTFDDVVGQEHVTRTLRNAIASGRIANAYLFVGSRGIGKTTLSRIFAKAINCPTPNGVEPCGACESCRQIAEGRSIDVTELDGASHNKVEDVRPIIEGVQFKPAASKYKIFIVDECHMLTPAAWNALLKTLEEPPPYVRFIFATTEGDKLLATIISRCQRFDLRRIQTHQIAARLQYICGKEGITADQDALLAIARGAEGGMRDALSSLDQLIAFKGNTITEEDALSVFGLVSRKALEDLAGAILKGDAAAILQSVEAFDSAGKNMRRLAGELLRHFRNLIVYQSLGGQTASLEATPDQIKTLADLKGKIVGVQTDTPVQKALSKDGDKKELGATFKELVVMPNYNQAVNELNMGGVDAVAMDVGVAKKKMADLPGKFEMLGEIVMTETYGIGFKKGNVSLKDEVEATLKEIFADGTGAKIAEKYQIEPNALLLK